MERKLVQEPRVEQVQRRPEAGRHQCHLVDVVGTSCVKSGGPRQDLAMRGPSGDDLGRHVAVAQLDTLAGREGDARLLLADQPLHVLVAVDGLEQVGPQVVVVVLHVAQPVGVYLYAAMGDDVESRGRISPSLGMAGPK